MAERIERDDDLPAAVGLAIRQNLAKEAVAGDAIQLREASESLEGESALAPLLAAERGCLEDPVGERFDAVQAQARRAGGAAKHSAEHLR